MSAPALCASGSDNFRRFWHPFYQLPWKKHSIRPRKTQSTLCLPKKKGHPEGALDKKRRCYYNKTRGKALAVDVVSSFPGLCQKIDRSVGEEQRRSIFFYNKAPALWFEQNHGAGAYFIWSSEEKCGIQLTAGGLRRPEPCRARCPRT